MPASGSLRTLRTWIRCAVATLALLLVAPHTPNDVRHWGPGSARHLFEGGLTCIIDTGNDMLNRTELSAGFNYEMVKLFAADHHCGVSIRIAGREENAVDSLVLGAADILVLDRSDSTALHLAGSSSIGRHCAWYVKEEDDAKLTDINLWLNSFVETKEYRDLRSRFNANYNPYMRVKHGITSRKLSPYDNLIRTHAKTLGWDWRLLVAVIYQESKFAINTTSRRGATGLMQVMPATGLHYGVDDLLDPEQNLIAGTSFLAYLQRAFPKGEFSDNDRISFTLAAYNAGEGRITDCRMFADLRNLDSTKWEEIVKIIPDMREYTIESPDDSTVVRTGRFKGTETINYVNQVLDLYSLFCQICPEK